VNISAWLAAGAQYLPLINGTENAFGIPINLLARVAYQECSWRPEVINCTVKSSAGAVGMFQLMPKYFPNAGASIAADCRSAAQLLASLYKRFGDWQIALAAYNWGQGDVHHEIVTEGAPTLADMPSETQNYVRDIVADVFVPGTLI